jgi:hypothetical protein
MKTAVEWLFLMMNNPNKDQEFANKLLEKAKEMEKQQIIDCCDISYMDGYNDNGKQGEQYYNETYNKSTL